MESIFLVLVGWLLVLLLVSVPSLIYLKCDVRAHQLLTKEKLVHKYKTYIFQMSKPMPVTMFQAEFIQMCAILGPTPGSLINSATLSGMSELYLSNSICDVAFMYFVLF